MIIRRMNHSDLDGVFEVDQNCFNHNWSRESYEKEMDNLLAIYAIAESEGKIIGFGGFWRVIDEAQITNIGVLETYRRTGVGEKILDKLCQFASQEGCEKMTLEVREDNLPAIAFYKKNLFVQEGIRHHYYGQNQHGLIMWRYQLDK